MIQPEGLAVGAVADIGSHGYTVRVGRESTDSWRLSRFPEGWPSGLASARIVRETDDRPEPWIVEPTNPLIDAEEFDTWDAALAFATTLEPRLP